MNKKLLYGCLTFAVSILPFFLISRALFIKDPPVWPDEAVFADAARTFIQTGVVATNIYGESFAGFSGHMSTYPPLYIWILSVWMRVAGTSIEAVRILSLLIATCTLTVLFILMYTLFHSYTAAGAGILAITLNSAFRESAQMGRMEILVLLFTILSILLYIRAYKRQQPLLYWGAGISSALAFLTHPMGLLALLITCIFLVNYETKLRRATVIHAAALLIPTLGAGLLWVASSGSPLYTFIPELMLHTSNQFSVESSLIYMARMSIIQRQLLLLYLIAVVMQVYIVIKNNHTIDRIILWGTLISFVAVLLGRINWHNVYLEPFLTLLFISLLTNAIRSPVHIRSFIIAGLLLGIVITDCIVAQSLTTQATSIPEYHKISNELAKILPKSGTIVLATIPDPYFDLAANPNLTLRESPTLIKPNDAYRAMLNSADIAVVNYEPTPFLYEYLNINTRIVRTVHFPDGYTTNVFTLKPKNERK